MTYMFHLTFFHMYRALFSVTVLLMVFLSGCSSVEVKKVCSPNNPRQCVYLKRDTRGLNYEVAAISNNSARKIDRDSKDDAIIPFVQSTMFYKFENGLLVIKVLELYPKSSVRKLAVPYQLVEFPEISEYWYYMKNHEELGYKKF